MNKENRGVCGEEFGGISGRPRVDDEPWKAGRTSPPWRGGEALSESDCLYKLRSLSPPHSQTTPTLPPPFHSPTSGDGAVTGKAHVLFNVVSTSIYH